MSEKVIERYLVEQARRAGMLCLKYANPAMAGYPDRLLVLPSGRTAWVELKSRGRKPSKLQLLRHGELAGLGHMVSVIDNKADVDNLIEKLKI